MGVHKEITVDSNFWKMLRKIAIKRSYSMATVFRNALTIYIYIHRKIDEGNEVKIIATNKETGDITEADVTHDI